MSSKSIYPYVYKIVDKETGEFYIGSRYANVKVSRTPDEDFLIHYFSSGKLRTRVKEDLSKFEGSIVFKFDDLDVVYWYEQLLIKESINDKKCINGNYIDPDSGIKKFSRAGKIHSEDHKRKISNSVKSLMMSEENRKRISESMKGHIQSEDTRKKISDKMKGRKHSEETRMKMSKIKHENMKLMECPHCKKSGSGGGMTTWHFDKCKFNPTNK